MTLYVITGATGFIGQHLVGDLVKDGHRIRALARNPADTGMTPENVEWIAGDIADSGVWDRLLEPECIVINLAYSNSVANSDAIKIMSEMIEACARFKVLHLIHCSTVAVYGRSTLTFLDEDSPCVPFDNYGKVKLQLEQTLQRQVRGRFAATIIRPSAVFGTGGEAVKKMVRNLAQGRRFVGYLRACLFGKRKTHLVPVQTVVAALRFLCSQPAPSGVPIFIVADDSDACNNFYNVEMLLMLYLDIPSYPLPVVPLPRTFLELLIRMRRRAIVNTQTQYSSSKLLDLGFTRPLTLETALRQFAVSEKTRIGPASK